MSEGARTNHRSRSRSRSLRSLSCSRRGQDSKGRNEQASEGRRSKEGGGARDEKEAQDSNSRTRGAVMRVESDRRGLGERSEKLSEERGARQC
eukprot:3639045-Rhodomonas_salina.1